MPHTVLIAGYFGFRNTGDETILEAMVRDLRMLDPSLSIIVVSGNPQETGKLHQVQSVPWTDIQQITSAIKTCDLVILGGGGIFHDYWGFDQSTILTSDHIGISFYTSIAFLSTILKKRLMLYSVGVGPLLSEEGKSYVRSIAEQASIITVRDKESKEQLIALKIPANHILLTADPAFRLRFPLPEKDPTDKDLSGEFQLGVALRNWDVGVNPNVWEANVAKGIDLFLDNHPKAKAIFIPFQDSQEQLLDDQVISTRVQQLLRNSNRTKVINGTSTFFDSATYLAQCDFVLGMRLHSLILAIASGVPVVGLIYDPKVKNLMFQVGVEKYAMELGEATDTGISKTIEDVIHHRLELSLHLQETSSQLANSAFTNAQIVVDHLNQSGYKPPKLSHITEFLLNRVLFSLVDNLEIQTKKNRDIVKKLEQIESTQARQNLPENILDTEIASLKKKLVDLEGNIEFISTRNAELLSKNVDYQRHFTDLTQENVNIKAAYDDLVHRNGQLMNDQKQADERIDHLQKLNSELQLLISESTDKNNKIIKNLVAKIDHNKKDHSRKLEILKQQSSEKEQEVSRLAGELENIKHSRGWKILWEMWQFRLYLIPNGSRRERVLGRLYRNVRSLFSSPVRFGRKIAGRILHNAGLRMSNQAFAFHLYKLSRNKLFKPNLNALHVSSQSGLVSIVLPVYNGSSYLREALDSIIDQTYSHFEVIIIDDGSTDDSGKIADEYSTKDDRIRVIHQANQKLPQSLNNGFYLARGEYLTWTSHDNILKPEFLEKMVKCLSNHPSWDMIYANMDIIDEYGKPLQNSDWYGGYQVPYGSSHIHLPQNSLELNTWPNNFIGGAFLYRKRVQDLLTGYSPNQFTREDYDYWMQVNSLMILKHADFNHPVYNYRFHRQSLTSQDKPLKISQDRKYLMLFDDFRRDFYLMPVIWIIDQDGEESDLNMIRQSVERILKSQGNVPLSMAEFIDLSLPRLWLPAIYLKIARGSNEAAPPIFSQEKNITRAILCIDDQSLPPAGNPGWDVCLAYEQEEHSRKNIADRPGCWSSREIPVLIHALDIKARSQHLAKIEKTIADSHSNPRGISVIICTYKRNQILEKSLRSIASQTLPQKKYEVIIVDNDPFGSGLSGLVDQIRSEAFHDHPEHLRLVQCPVLGLSFARNAGMAEAKYDNLLFLDDDSVARSDILEQYSRGFLEHPEAGVIGGHITLKLPENLPMIWKEGWERYWSQFITGFNQYSIVTRWWEFPWGANWAASRKALMQIGGFRGKYGRKGNDFNGGEEIVAANLIQQLGYSIAILPQAKVIHYVEHSRFTTRHLKNTIRSSMFVQYLAQQGLHIPNETNLGSSIHQELDAMRKCISLVFHPGDTRNKANLMEVSFQMSARFQLLLRQVLDGFRRMRFQ